MNILSFNTPAGQGEKRSSKSIYAGGLSLRQNAPLKSTQEKLQRRQKADSQVEFWENKKKGLKNMECTTPDEIARKLEMFHTYEDEIASAKAAYNNEQMFHILDEAMEQGEKNAKAAEKTKPKTPEERMEETVEEALGIDDQKGILSEVLDEVMEEALKAAEEMSKNADSMPEDAIIDKAKEAAQIAADADWQLSGCETPDGAWMYKGFDARI